MSAIVTEEKRALRAHVRAETEALGKEARRASDQALLAWALSLPVLAAAQTVLLFYGVGIEPRTAPLISALLAAGKTVALPRCLPDRGMEARRIFDLDELRPGAYGIPEPPPACPVLPKEALDLILVPALCCDKSGYRLGQGGGYYDRYLEHYKGGTAALCRDALLRDELPREPHDRPVALVVTETRLFRA